MRIGNIKRQSMRLRLLAGEIAFPNIPRIAVLSIISRPEVRSSLVNCFNVPECPGAPGPYAAEETNLVDFIRNGLLDSRTFESGDAH